MEPCPRPTLKLNIAFLGMCWLVVDGACRELLRGNFDWVDWVIACISVGFGVWIAWHGIFKSVSMHWLWGWPCLALGGTLLIMLAGWLMFGWPSVTKLPMRLVLLGIIGMPVTGWLLVMDRDVSRYRKHLREMENEARRLRFEKQDQENECHRLRLKNQALN